MDSSSKFPPCTECAKHGKPVIAILLIVLGVSLLAGEILRRKDQA